MIGFTAGPESGWDVISWTGTNHDGSKATTNQVTMPPAARAITVHYGNKAAFMPLARR